MVQVENSNVINANISVAEGGGASTTRRGNSWDQMNLANFGA